MVKEPTVISLFAGCGGSSLGYKLAGYKELLAVEWNDNAVATFKLNFPGVPVYHGDIAKLSSQECMKLAGVKVGELDILDASPPCQGFSTAGKRKLHDARNSLSMEFARLLRDLQPRAFVMENVTGLIRGHMKQVYLQMVQVLRDCGYKVKGQVLNAMYYDVPQSRQRVIIVGVRNSLSVEPSHPKPQGIPVTVREAIGDLPKTQDASMGHVWVDEWTRRTKWIKYVPAIKQGGHLPCTTQYRRLYWDKPSFTLTRSGLNGMPCYVRNSHIHPSENRALSVREMARLASFPDCFEFTEALTEGNHCIGNSVPPNLMKAIAEHIKENILQATREVA